MNFVIGEILFDLFPDYRRLGGAPFNVAYHLKHFGLPVRFITRVGSDPEGEEIRQFLAGNGFDLDDVQIDRQHPTGTVRVELDGRGVPQFDIIADVAYDHLATSPAVVSALADSIGLIYFGTLIQRTESGHQMLQDLLNRRGPRIRCFYDINLRPNCYRRQTVQDSLQQADYVKLNHQELVILQDMFGWAGMPEAAAHQLMDAFDIKVLSLTRGEDGSELFTAAGCFAAPSTRPVDVVDTVGAGDAYTAVLIAGLLRDWQPERMLKAAAEFAARICEIAGAIPKDTAIYTGIIDRGDKR